jgi:hypothetical protein
VHVGNLLGTETEENMRNAFKEFGTIDNIRVPGKNFGFVAFTTHLAVMPAGTLWTRSDERHVQAPSREGRGRVRSGLGARRLWRTCGVFCSVSALTIRWPHTSALTVRGPG